MNSCIANKKFWPNWIGIILFCTAGVLSLKWNASIMKLRSWESSIDQSMDMQNMLGMFCLFPILLSSFAICEYATNSSFKLRSYLQAFAAFYILSVLCFMVGSQSKMKQYGFGYALLSLILSMFIINLTTTIFNTECVSKFLQPAISNGEFYIKCGLVLLATDLKTVVSVGSSGLIVSWFVPPLIIIFMWFFGTKVLKQTNHAFVISLAAGAAICGVSAICAVAAVVELSSEDTAMAVSILSFFTIIYMLGVPYIALYFNLDKHVSGAWIAGSVDGTGNVVASVGILDDDEAYATAVVIKMAQNMLIGAVCLVVAMLFKKDGKKAKKQKKKKSEGGCLFLWKKFPKFILGYLLLSIIISVVVQPYASNTYYSNFMSNMKQLSKWLFCFGFLGVGSSTIFAKLFKQLKGGKPLALYLVGQTVDTIVTLLCAWLVMERTTDHKARHTEL